MIHTNVPVDESIAQAANLIYERKVPAFDKDTFIRLLGRAVKNDVFQSGGRWYKQVGGLAMGSKLAVYLSNIWLRQFEPCIGGKSPEDEEDPSTLPIIVTLPIIMDEKNPCGNCGKTVTRRGFSAQCNRRGHCYHMVCLGFSTAQMRTIKPGQRVGCIRKISGQKKEPSKLFFRYMDDILTCIKEEQKELLETANNLPKNLTFTIEREENENLPLVGYEDLQTQRKTTLGMVSKTDGCWTHYALSCLYPN